MNTAIYRELNAEDKTIFSEMVKALYEEDPEGKPMTTEKIMLTINHFQNYPDRGMILLVELDNETIGYAIILKLWSNEYGGIVLMIDELYITPKYRSKGIGKEFIQFINEKTVNQHKAITLDVNPGNVRALRFYQMLGFEVSSKKSLFKESN